MRIAPENDLETAVGHVFVAAPRLLNIAAHTAISFGLWDGANRALSDVTNIDDDIRQCAAGYRGDSASMTVMRLAQLLDRDPVSFQSVYRCLQRSEVVESLIRHRSSETLLAEVMADRLDENIRHSVARFLDTYRAIDWAGLHGRLKDFRNRGLAHLTPDGIKQRITFSELRKLVHSVVILRECLMPFAPDAAPFHEDEIEDWSKRAAAMWNASFRTKYRRCE
jgi:hypothetical protein